MPRFLRSVPVAAVCALLVARASYAQHTPIEKLQPCEAFSQASAVFVGVAGAPVSRRVQLPNQPQADMMLTPITVERAYTGVVTPVVYLTPLGVEEYATAGKRYLVYGRQYRPPDIVMASPGYGAKPIENAAEDLAFLDGTAPGVKGGAIIGIVQQKELTYEREASVRAPLERVRVRIFNERHATEAVSGVDGRFFVSVPAGNYELVPELADDLVVLDPTSKIRTHVTDGGCATVTIDTTLNGRVRGVVRGPDGQPVRTFVDLVPMDIEPDARSGRVHGQGSVSSNRQGEFEFAGLPAGRYYLGVSLYNAPNPNGIPYPRTYYPGTTERASAVPVIIERGRPSDGYDFTIPAILAKGEMEVIVESEYQGELKFCVVQLEDLVNRWTTHYPERGVPQRVPVVEGMRYEVHAHLEYLNGHLESEPFVFTATTEKIVIRLRPDAPRTLHK